MRQSLWSRFASAHHEFPHRRDLAVEIGSLVITGNPIGAVLSIDMFIIVWSARARYTACLYGCEAALTQEFHVALTR